MNEETKIMGWIGILIWAFIWGFVTEKINESKGYKGGFALGFFLSWIGLIIVISKPKNTNNEQIAQNNNVSPSLSESEQIMKYKKMLDDGIITQEEFEMKRKQILGL